LTAKGVSSLAPIMVLSTLVHAAPADRESRSNPACRPDPVCRPDNVRAETLKALRFRSFLDAHTLVQATLVLCAPTTIKNELKLYDAIALVELEETQRAREQLREAMSDFKPEILQAAEALNAWTFLRDDDQTAFLLSLRRLPTPTRNRLQAMDAVDRKPELFEQYVTGLNDELKVAAIAAFDDFQLTNRIKRPWVASLMSGLLPGAGQAYAGSWQGAAVAFVLNAIFLGATIELAQHRLYATSTAAGLAASVFYVGNIINAGDLAHRRNEAASNGARQELERLLVPEAHPWISTTYVP